MMRVPIFELKDISKSFGTNTVLNGVSLSVQAGEVRALMGENGAGKSTLMKILGGIYSADAGETFIDGKPAAIHKVEDARRFGVSFIHQEISNVPHMTIAENLFLGREPKTRTGLVDQVAMHREARKALDVMGLDMDTRRTIAGLSIAQQQMLEIARAIGENARILIMDEPTASLSTHEVDSLFAQVRRLKGMGVAIIYISHRMDETFAICDSVTVLRDGVFIGTRQTAEASESELISMMVGRELDTVYGQAREFGGETVLSVRGLTTAKVTDISFDLKKGEILGFAGLVGSGRTETALALFGIDRIHAGEIRMHGRPLQIQSPRDAIRAGIALVPEDRKGQGLFLRHSIRTNLSFQVLGSFIRRLGVNRREEGRIIDEYRQKLSIRMASVDQLANELSGGNQQKIVISKWLAARPDVLILDEPTRGIDVGAKSEIYRLMHSLAREGVSIIMISSELPEIINHSSRIAVMREGRLATVLDLEQEDVSQEKIISHAI